MEIDRTFNPCPTDAIYAIEVTDDTGGVSGFATLTTEDVDLFMLVFDTSDIATASEFTFDQNPDGTCSLVSLEAPGLFSAVIDDPGEFVGFHYVYLTNPTVVAADGQVETPVSCTIDTSDVLSCIVVGSDQDVLQLFGDTLTIAAVDEGTGGGTFVVVPIV